jgi:hypothetical protein
MKPMLTVSRMMISRWTSLLFLTLPLNAEVNSWELEPMKYSGSTATDHLSQLAERWTKDPASLPSSTPLERVRAILAALHVPEASQILVFSKTSKQSELITPANPRALYFSSDCYCGYVPGGVMEITIQDPRLGPVFYTIDLGNSERSPRVERNTDACLSCHGTARTENTPGLFMRSVYPDDNGRPRLSLGSRTVSHETPVPERWGGYYVTGSISRPHLGNRTYADDSQAEPQRFSWNDLRGKIETKKYLRATSDVVALMVLEHQCRAHNLLTAASMNYQRAAYLGRQIDPEADPDHGSAGRAADSAAAEIVEWFLFRGEADQGEDGVEGDTDFQQQFEAKVPRTKNGESLADFQLNGRLFKNRCSYMIYSAAFSELPDAVKTRVIAGLKKVLDAPHSDDTYPRMKLLERRKIARILHETGVW